MLRPGQYENRALVAAAVAPPTTPRQGVRIGLAAHGLSPEIAEELGDAVRRTPARQRPFVGFRVTEDGVTVLPRADLRSHFRRFGLRQLAVQVASAPGVAAWGLR